MSESEAFRGVVDESVESMKLAPGKAPRHGIGRDAARPSDRVRAETRQVSATFDAAALTAREHDRLAGHAPRRAAPKSLLPWPGTSSVATRSAASIWTTAAHASSAWSTPQ
jgi:hypothetical protein